MIDIIAIDQLSVTVFIMLLLTETIWRQLRKWVVLFYISTTEDVVASSWLDIGRATVLIYQLRFLESDQPFFSLNAGLFFSHQVVL